MRKDLIKSFRAGDELTVELVDAILSELCRLRKMTAVPPLCMSNAEGGSPPVIHMAAGKTLIPFQAPAVGVEAGSLSIPTNFTASIMYSTTQGQFIGGATAQTTTLGKHFMNIAIPASANGWAVWYDGYLWPLTWDGC